MLILAGVVRAACPRKGYGCKGGLKIRLCFGFCFLLKSILKLLHGFLWLKID